MYTFCIGGRPISKSKVVRAGQALVSIGSSGVVFAPSDSPRLHPEGVVHTFAHSVPSVWYVMGVTLAAGMSLRWVRDELGQRLIGGGAKIDFWHQLTADVLGIRASRLVADEGPGFGAALLAGVGSGLFGDVVEVVEQSVAEKDAVDPDADATRDYDEGFRFYRSLYPALQSSFRAAAERADQGQAPSD